MREARLAGVPQANAAVAFDCTAATMREHYLAFAKTRAGDRVFERVDDAGRARESATSNR